MFHALKFMLYLLDANEANGAFRYAIGSHHKNTKLRRRYVLCGGKLIRLPNICSPKESIPLRSISGPAGTLIIFDTDGFHSGGNILLGKERRVLRSRYLFSGQPPIRPNMFSFQWVRESSLNPLKFVLPLLAPPGRSSTGGTARKVEFR